MEIKRNESARSLTVDEVTTHTPTVIDVHKQIESDSNLVVEDTTLALTGTDEEHKGIEKISDETTVVEVTTEAPAVGVTSKFNNPQATSEVSKNIMKDDGKQLPPLEDEYWQLRANPPKTNYQE